MSRADRVSARLRFKSLRTAARHKFNQNEQILRKRGKPLQPFNITAALRQAWRAWARRFAGVRPWGRQRNANRRPSARKRLRVSSSQRARLARELGE